MDPLSLAIGTLSTLGSLVGGWYAFRQYRKPAIADDKRSQVQIPRASVEDRFTESDLDNVFATKRLRIGCVRYPPLLDFHLERGQLVVDGLYSLIMEEIRSAHGLTLEYIPLVWHEFESALAHRRVDMILSVFETDARRRFAQSAGVLHRIQVGAVARRERNKHWSESDLRSTEIRIGITEGEIGWEWANEFIGIEKNSHRIRVLKNDDITNVMDLLVTGKVDIVLADALSCSRFLEQHKKGFYNPFRTKALDVCRNGALVRLGQRQWAEWLTNEMRRARKSEAIQQRESEILTHYSDVVTKVD